MNDYERLNSIINGMYATLATDDYDRVEKTIHGFQIRVWRSRINSKDEIHIGYKNEWESEYHETTGYQLVEMLLQYVRVP